MPIIIVSDAGLKLQFNFDKKTKEFTLNLGKPNKSNIAVLDDRMMAYDKFYLKALTDEE